MNDTRSPESTYPDPRTVLVGIANPRTAGPMMDLTSRLVGGGGAHVLAAHVVVVPAQVALSSERASPAVAAASELLARAIEAARDRGVAADGVVEIGRAVHEGLASAADTRGVDLMIVGWSDETGSSEHDDGESDFDRLMHRVARSVDCDILVEKVRGDSLQRVLVPIADSPHVPLLAFVVRRLSATGSDVTFLHVIDEGADSDAARADVGALLARHGLGGLGPLEVVAAGSVSDTVVERAADHDVAVIGALAKTALAEPLFGSKAERIAAGAPCSVVLAYHAADESERRDETPEP